MKKVLLIGNANSVWIREYIKNIHLPMGNKVFLTLYEPLADNYKYDYESMNVTFIKLYKGKGLIDKINKTLALGLFLPRRIKALGIDLIDIQSPPHNLQGMVLGFMLKKSQTHSLLNFWGSDILCIGDQEAKYLKPVIENSNIINLGTEKLQEKFHSLFAHEFDQKIASMIFGSLGFEKIDEQYNKYGENAREMAKTIIGVTLDKVSILVGYNGKPSQNHLKIIDALGRLPQAVRDKLELIIHIGYGGSESYKKDVENALKSIDTSYIIIDKMLDLEQIATLRLATDIIIHGQDSDALSSSVRESIYAGAVLLNASWLRYQEFDNLNINYVTFSHFEEIGIYIQDVLSGQIKIDTQHNREMLRATFTWESVFEKWKEAILG